MAFQSSRIPRTSTEPESSPFESQPAEELPAAPRSVVDDEVTVPVQSSIESTLTFEVLRRQSTEEDEDDSES